MATAAPPPPETKRAKLNKVEQLKLDKDGLDVLPDIERYSQQGDASQISEDDAQRMKWFGLFTRKQTPGHMMMRLRAVCGRMNSEQWRLLAELTDRYGKGFCDLTTRQQIQMRWFTIGNVLDIWRQMLEGFSGPTPFGIGRQQYPSRNRRIPTVSASLVFRKN